MNLNPSAEVAVVCDVAEIFELIHKVTHPGSRGADHLGERFLTDLRNDRPRIIRAPAMREQEQGPSQPLLAGIEELIDQVFLDTNVTCE